MKKIQKRLKGETLLEVVVSLAIISIILIGAYSTLSTSISNNKSTEKKIIALNLAQEGIEIVRNTRDTNWLLYFGSRRENWNCFKRGSSSCVKSFSETEQYFTVDPYNPIFSSIILAIEDAEVLDIKNESMKYDSFLLKQNNNRYEHINGENTPFYRQVAVKAESNELCISGSSNNCTEERLKVTVYVQWKEEHGIEEFKLETYIYDFFERNSY